MAYFPCPIFQSEDDMSLHQQGGTKTFDEPVFLTNLYHYPFGGSSANSIKIEYPNGEGNVQHPFSLPVDEDVRVFVFLPAGTKVTLSNASMCWLPVSWVKVPELVSGGG